MKELEVSVLCFFDGVGLISSFSLLSPFDGLQINVLNVESIFVGLLKVNEDIQMSGFQKDFGN